jgi:hypothetical protein
MERINKESMERGKPSTIGNIIRKKIVKSAGFGDRIVVRFMASVLKSNTPTKGPEDVRRAGRGINKRRV